MISPLWRCIGTRYARAAAMAISVHLHHAIAASQFDWASDSFRPVAIHPLSFLHVRQVLVSTLIKGSITLALMMFTTRPTISATIIVVAGVASLTLVVRYATARRSTSFSGRRRRWQRQPLVVPDALLLAARRLFRRRSSAGGATLRTGYARWAMPRSCGSTSAAWWPRRQIPPIRCLIGCPRWC